METDNKSNTPAAEERDARQEARRAFLKKSIYAAYATPVLMNLLVEKANATQSWNPGKGKEGNGQGGNPWGSAPPPWVRDKNK